MSERVRSRITQRGSKLHDQDAPVSRLRDRTISQAIEFAPLSFYILYCVRSLPIFMPFDFMREGAVIIARGLAKAGSARPRIGIA